MPRLIVKFPTRNRPEKCRKMLIRYRDLLSGEHEVRFVVTCDKNDPTMNNSEMRNWFDRFGRESDLQVSFGGSRSKVQAANADMGGEVADVVLLASDDMNPIYPGYDKVLFDLFASRFADYRGAIRFHDGLRDDDLMTYPVVGWPLYRAIGHLYHPWYRSVYCDDELTEICRALGLLHSDPRCLLRHEWTHLPFDRLHRRNESRYFYKRDGAVFRFRRRMGFGIRRIESRLRRDDG